MANKIGEADVFLEILREPLRNIPSNHFMCMIYLQEKRLDSAKFVKNIEMKQPANEALDTSFERAIKYEAGIGDEENYDIRTGPLRYYSIGNTCIHTRFGKRKQHFDALLICIIYPKKEKKL